MKWGKEAEANGRRSGLMASAVDSGPNGLGSVPGQGNAFCFWEITV